jgi:hypothetical protein
LLKSISSHRAFFMVYLSLVKRHEDMNQPIVDDKQTETIIETEISFSVVGNKNIRTFSGKSKTFDTKKLTFETDQSAKLEIGMLLQVKMDPEENNNTGLQTMVEITKIDKQDDLYYIESDIKDIELQV